MNSSAPASSHVYDTKRGLHLDIHLPPQPASAPVVLYLHGGGFEAGSRAQHAHDRLSPLAARGVAIVSADYRLAPEAAYPGPVIDVHRAMAWLRENGADLGLRDGPIGLIGTSAGGYLAAAAALSAPGECGQIGLVSPWFAPLDLWASTRRSPLEMALDSRRLFETNLVPGLEAATLRDVSPVHRAGADAPPFLILHGDRDVVASHRQSELLHDALQRQGVESTLITVGGAGHDDPLFNAPWLLDVVASAFKRALRDPRTAAS